MLIPGLLRIAGLLLLRITGLLLLRIAGLLLLLLLLLLIARILTGVAGRALVVLGVVRRWRWWRRFPHRPVGVYARAILANPVALAINVLAAGCVRSHGRTQNRA